MANQTYTSRQQFLKGFPPLQQRAILGATQAYLSAIKTTAKSYTSNITVAPDPELLIPQVQANVPYKLTMVLQITASAAAGGLQLDFNAGTATISTIGIVTQFFTVAGVVTQSAPAVALSTAVTGGTAAIQTVAYASGVVVFATTGSFGLDLAQAGSSGTATVVDVNSTLLLEACAPSLTM
jgi:hypothetical protein